MLFFICCLLGNLISVVKDALLLRIGMLVYVQVMKMNLVCSYALIEMYMQR